ncbi:MAG: hypothetical protein WC455_18765 [Dehalococcoidia bacterium]|jgi:hypothetical protein
MDIRDIGGIAGGVVGGVGNVVKIGQNLEAIKTQQAQQAISGMALAKMKQQEAEYNQPVAIQDLMGRVPEQYRPFMEQKIAGSGIVETDPAGKPFVRRGRMGELKESLAASDYFNMATGAYQHFDEKEAAIKKQIEELTGTLKNTMQQYKEEGAMAPPPRESTVQELESYKKKDPTQSEGFKKGLLELRGLYQALDGVKKGKMQNFMTLNNIKSGLGKLIEHGFSPETVMGVATGAPGSHEAFLTEMREIEAAKQKPEKKQYDLLQDPEGNLKNVEKGAPIKPGYTLPPKRGAAKGSGTGPVPKEYKATPVGQTPSGAVVYSDGKSQFTIEDNTRKPYSGQVVKGGGGKPRGLSIPGVGSATGNEPSWAKYAK